MRPTDETDARQERKSWSARSIGSRWQHQFFYTLIRLAGRRAAHVLVVFVALYYVLFRPSVRARSRPYLSRRFPGRNGLLRLWDSYRITVEIGQVLVDRAALGILGPGQLTVRHSGREDLLEQVREGRGVILVTAHAGCWQFAIEGLHMLETPVSLLLHREEDDVDLHIFEHRGEDAAFRIIDPAGPLGGALEMLQVLKHGEVLCIMGDRAMGGDRSTVEVAFLGGRVRVPFIPYQLASTTGAPVVVIFPYKSGPGNYSLQVAEVIRVPEDLGRTPEAYRPYAEAFIRALEGFVEERPYQFFNFFDMWNQESIR
ncbi:MAG: lipid A biosynthesis acyltransferase [Deltaproteobacteria bacterium]|nr:MAG: lipid A biosynthesis acyltransferase [Deltaproteobacteria bacterium]